MLKNISSLGRALNKAEQKGVNGGGKTCLSNCVGKPHGTACWSADCSCPGMCANSQCAMY